MGKSPEHVALLLGRGVPCQELLVYARPLECGSESSPRKQEDENVPRDRKVQGLGDLQMVLLVGRKVRVAVDREGAGLAGC